MAAGCYSPAPPSGAYRCSVADQECPSGQQCVCGLCVNDKREAACKFAVDTAGVTTVAEHQPFTINVTALEDDGRTAAAGYNGTVTLDFSLPDGSRWCDVTPSTLTFKNGKVSQTVSLNRETIPPQTPTLGVRLGALRTAGGSMTVTAPPLTRDATAVVPPVSPGSAFGFADAVVAEPDVVWDGQQFRMYFIGLGLKLGTKAAIGVATSPDGHNFTPRPDPVLTPASGTFYDQQVQSPSVFRVGSSYNMIFSGTQTFGTTEPAELGLATSPDGLAPFVVANGGQPVLKRKILNMQMADCDYCQTSIDFPQVIPDPSLSGDMGARAWLLFFSAQDGSGVPSIGRASSSNDGATWVPEPAPVLNGDLGGEAVLLAPHVLVDGTVFKMWYSWARLGDFKLGQTFCDTNLSIGYATSADGFYWVRSPSNVKASPAVTAGGWDAGVNTFIAGAVVPANGTDLSSGIAVYYTTFRHATADPASACEPNGIGRAVRP